MQTFLQLLNALMKIVDVNGKQSLFMYYMEKAGALNVAKENYPNFTNYPEKNMKNDY